jgi:hypothetical protein
MVGSVAALLLVLGPSNLKQDCRTLTRRQPAATEIVNKGFKIKLLCLSSSLSEAMSTGRLDRHFNKKHMMWQPMAATPKNKMEATNLNVFTFLDYG